jgi:predicted ATPase/DNA-binding SARP family transcriptional activator
MSAKLALHLLGHPQIELDNIVVGIHRRKVAALLIYLAVQGATHSREFLSALLWPEYKQSKAFTNLRHTLWEIQHSIGGGWLTSDRETIGLRESTNIWVDIREFRSILLEASAQKASSYRIPFLVDAISLYREPFLAGFDLNDAPIFTEWASNQMENLQAEYASALSLLSDDYCHIDQAEKAVPPAKKLIRLDPLNEDYHRKLMHVYVQAGQPGAALKQYQICEQVLRRELNTPPQPETLELYNQIRHGEVIPVRAIKQAESFEPAHNMPVFLSTFIGRTEEKSDIAGLLLKHRLVTLAGMGGIGKTRLALEVAHELLTQFPDGVWFIPLEAISDPALVPQTVAAVFDIREGEGERSLTRRLTNILRDKTVLLVFDNCEHLLKACTHLIKILLSSCPKLRVLATSRTTLSMDGEATYSPPPLTVPGDEVVFDELIKYESIRFFLDRAMRSSASFTLTQENARTIIEICRRLDGIPLAIELAAAHVNIMQAGEILKQLRDSFAELTNSDETTIARHYTLQASMDWSWMLLDNDEKRFLRQLSVFSGGWILEAAQAVFRGNVLRLTSTLAKKSFIVVNQKQGRETRYRFHETVRQYTHERLLDSGEENDIRTRHLQYFLRLSEEAEPALRGPTQTEWLSRLNDERDNIRTALAWAEKTDVKAGLYILGRLYRFWERSEMQEAAKWLAMFTENPESKAYPHARAKALHAQGWILTWMQQFAQAHVSAKECLDLFKGCGDRAGETDGLLLVGYNADAKQRMELSQQAFVLARSLGDTWRQAIALSHFGYSHGGDERLVFLEQAIRLFHQCGDWSLLVNLLSTFGYFVLLQGDFELAQQRLDEAIRLNDQLNDKDAKSVLLQSLGEMAVRQGDYRKAHGYYQEALSNWEELGTRMNAFWCRAHLGFIALREADFDQAWIILADTVQNFQQDGSDIGVAFSFEVMAELYIIVDKPYTAARLIGWADTTREKISGLRPHIEQADVDKIIAACVAKMGEVAFSEAYEEGKKMIIDEVVAYALNEKRQKNP